MSFAPNVLRVCHVLPGAPFGGLQRIALEMASRQISRGFEVRLLAISPDTNFKRFVCGIGIDPNVTYIDRLQFVRLRNEIVASRGNLLHLHDGVLWSHTAIFFLCRSSPIILHAHSYPPNTAHPKTRAISEVLHHMQPIVVAVSDDVARSWVRSGIVQAGRVHTIYNGLEGYSIEPTRSTGHSFGAATRLDRTKGVFELLRAASEILRLDKHARFTVAGVGPDAGEMKEAADALGIGNAIELKGFMTDLPNFYANEVDVALFTSPREAFGLSLLEPILSGTPVVAFRNGSGSDELIDRCRGIIGVPRGDYRRFAGEAIGIARDGERRSQLVSAGQLDITRNFSFKQMLDCVEALYRSVA